MSKFAESGQLFVFAVYSTIHAGLFLHFTYFSLSFIIKENFSANVRCTHYLQLIVEKFDII